MPYGNTEQLSNLGNRLIELRRFNRIGDRYILYAYILYIASSTKQEVSFADLFSGKLIKDPLILSAIKEEITKEIWENLKPLKKEFDSQCFATFALSYSKNQIQSHVLNGFQFDPETPLSIIKLSEAILNIKNNEKVADICCGSGGFLVDACMKNKNATYFGYEINTKAAINAYIRSVLLEDNISIELCNVFDIVNKESKYFTKGQKFDKIFANYPFGLRLKDIGSGSTYLSEIEKRCPTISKSTSSDWAFNLLISDLLSEQGRGIGIMTNGSTWNTMDTPVREYFVKNGLIEAIIALPGKLFVDTPIPTSLIVLGHNKNQTIRMIDATELCEQGRRENILTENNIAEILQLYTKDAKKSKLVDVKTIEKNDYVLNPSRYLDTGIELKNAVKFGTVIKNITRGANFTANQLDDMASNTRTDFQYLQLANIRHGQIDDDLPYLKSIDEKYLKYCLKNRCLIISKNSIPYKVAIAEIKDNKTVLASGNLYIIELDEKKANPYYIKAFLDSQIGYALLKSITVGAVIPNIGIEALKNMPIQLPDMEEQNKIAEEYLSVTDEIKILKLRMEKALNKLNLVYDKACGG